MQDDKYSEKKNFGLVYMYPSKADNPPTKETVSDTKKEKKKKKKKKKIKLHKCYICNKRLNITEQQMTCKCGANFCPKHRLQTYHNCPKTNNFDEESFKQKCGLGGGKFKQLEVL